MLLEEKLIKLAQKGDKTALGKLLQSNYSILKGYLLKMTMNEALTEDIVQETMVKAIMNIKKYKPKGKFSTWLITIATNYYRDKLRKDKRLVLEDDYSLYESANDLEQSVMNKMDIEKINRILHKLPEEKRMVFVLKHYYGYDYKEISEIVKCPIGTVRSRLHYCIKEIKLQMEGVKDNE